jgi:hypothetical protein
MASRVHVGSNQGNGVPSLAAAYDAGATSTAGNLVRVFVKYEGPSRTLSVSDGTSSFSTPGQVDNAASGNDMHTQEFYLLSANGGKTGATVTFTGGNGAFVSIFVEEFAGAVGGGTWSLDGTPVTTASNGATLNSGNTTTSGTEGAACAGYGEYSIDAINSATINGVNAFSTLRQLSGTTASAIWFTTYSAGFTGASAATRTGGPTDPWNMSLMTFKYAAGGGGGATSLLVPSRVNMGALLQM